MNLQQRDLTVGLTGSDVATLHGELTQLGYSVPAQEQQASRFGSGTLAAVEQFLAAQGLPATGTVDAATAAALSTVITGSTYVVTGTVSSPNHAAVGALNLQLVDKNVGGDQTLTTGITGSDGSYSLKVVIPTVYLTARHKTKPDLQVRALSGEQLLASSLVHYGAPLTVTLNVNLPPTAAGLPSEYESLAANIGALFPGKLSALRESADQQDVSFLANKGGWDARMVAFAALASQFSEAALLPAPAGAAPGAPPPAAPGAAAPPAGAAAAAAPAAPAPAAPALAPALAAEFCYALFRAGVPANADAVYNLGPSTVQNIWTRAVAQGVIPQSLAAQIPVAVNSFVALSANYSLGAASPTGLSTLQQMLGATTLTGPQQQQFAQLASQYRDNWSAFWPAATQAFGASATQRLQFLGQLFYLTANNAPLVTAFLNAESKNAPTSTLELATRGYYDPAKWVPLIGTSIPTGVPGTGDAQRLNYAQVLAAQVRIAHPTAVLSDQVRLGVIPTAASGTVSDVTSFLNTYQDQFAIGVEPVEAFIARTNIAVKNPAVVTEIKRLQRVYQLTSDDASMGVLLRHNLDSAFAINRYDSAGFQRAFSGKLGGSDKAAAVHRRARQVTGATLSILAAYGNARQAPNWGGSSPVKYGFTPPAPPSYPVAAYATLEDLFGSLDYCNCSDCGSVLSPAAYLVNLLNYIDQPSPTTNFENPQDVLFTRRPDLQYLPLTCANTNTALPYIDIVNETLEYFVANGLSLANYEGHDSGDTITSAELLASPQYVNDAAYTHLQGVFFPPPLPFNRPLGLLRLQLQNLGVALPDAMIALRSGDQLTNTATPTSYGWNDILIEQLGISRDEARVFTDSTLQLGDLYGLPNATALATLQNSSLQDFSRRVGVSYDDIVAILETGFINPDAVLIPRLQQLNAPFSTLKTLHDTLGTPASIATDFKNALPAGLDATQYGGSSPGDYDAVVAWVTSAQIYPRIMDLITISNPTGSADDCSGAALELRYSNPDNTQNLLTSTDLIKLIRFIRLWGKLAPLLGDSDDTVTIAQTDAILGALYPAADLPVSPSNPANDATNRPLLDAGFQVLLLRTGFLFQVMNRLSLNADAALEQLLACWAPIGTVGSQPLYQRMFLTPTLLQQDPGAQTLTVGNAVNTGDQFQTTIAGVAIPTYTAPAGATATSVATAITNSINTTTTIVPGTTALNPGGVAFNELFWASSNAAVITVKGGFTLACSLSAGASETYTAAKTSAISRTATVGVPATSKAGDVLTTTIEGIAIPYTVVAGDTAASIAAAIASAINTTTAQDPLSGLPLNSLVVASSSATGVVSLLAANAGAPFMLTCGYTPASAGSYAVGASVAAGYKATVTGGVAAGDTLVTTINSVPVSYTAVAADNTTAKLAASIANAISTAVQLDPSTELPIGSLVQAMSAGTVIAINPIDPATAFSVSGAVSAGAETYTVAGAFAASQTATLTGTFPAGAVLTTTINGFDITYTVVAGDTLATIATKIATSVNAETSPDPVTNLPLNTVVSAAAAGPVITLTAASPTTSFTLDVSVAAGAYSAGRMLPPFADDGYGDFLVDLTQTLFGHEPLLCAACNLTGAEFTLIAQALGFTASTPLTLVNVSALFRYGWLAHTLGISVLEFLRLREFTGLDPFAPLDPATTAPAEPPIIRFIRLLQTLSTVGLQPVQALYLMWNQDLSGKATPPLANITALALALRADFAAVEAQFALQDDPTGAIAQSLMTLVYGSTATDFFFGLLNNTFSTSIPYSNPAGQATLPPAVVSASGGRLGYDDLSKQLSFAGYLDPATLAALTALLTVNTTDSTDNVAAGGNVTFTPTSMTDISVGSVLTLDSGAAQETVAVTAVTPTTFTATTVKAHNGAVTPFPIVNDPTLGTGLASLASASAQAVGPFFATYPELQPLYAAYVASSDPVQTKRTTLLSNFLPTLKRERKQEQALAEITASVGSDPSFATELLQDPTIVHAAADPTLAAVADLTALENTGLTAQFFLGNDPTATPDQTVDYVAPLSYVQTATVGGAPKANDVLTTSINGVAIPYQVSATDTSAPILAASIAATLNAATAVDPVSHLPMNQVVSASSSGAVVAIGGAAPTGANNTFALICSVSAGATETYTAGSQLPASATPIAAVWSGYLTVPQNGFYDFAIAADAGATVALEIDGSPVTLAASGGLWRNQGPVSLTAGVLTPITLTATSIKTTFAVSWESLGTGWQPIPGGNLYPWNLVSRLGATYGRFLMAASLASSLSLTADEMAYLDTYPSNAVNTTNPTAMAAAANAVFTPASLANIAVGSALVIDGGSAQETVTVTAVTPPTTFTATTTHAHDGTVTPFPVVDQAAPDLGHGWLNSLGIAWDPVHPDLVTAGRLCNVLTALLDYARIKQALSPSDERLLAVLKNPAAMLPNTDTPLADPTTPVPASQSALLSLTGWALDSLNALLTQFFGTLGAGNLCDVENFRRVYDAYTIVETCRVTATTLIAGISNAPTSGMVSALQSALRALYAEADWLTAVRPLNDTMRIAQRDALLAYILQQMGDAYEASLIEQTTSAAAATGATSVTVASAAALTVGMGVQGISLAPGTTVTALAGNTVTLSAGALASLPTGWALTFIPANASQISTADDLFQYFLIDPQTQPPVETSRIRLALSAVQLFIERIVRNLEPEISPSDIDANQWLWMKRYRLWQANMEVFLWPENWLYPELRDNQSPIFQEMMSNLLQGDITDDAATEGYLSYLTGLEEVAKLEPCGMYYVPGTADTDETAYVISRTAGQHQKYFFRQLQYGSWTPWTEVKIDCEDMPLTPVVWNNRLFLFWLKLMKHSTVQSVPAPSSNAGSQQLTSSSINDLLSAGPSTSAATSNIDLRAMLCWTEYYNGAWQPTKTSDSNRTTDLGWFPPSGAGSIETLRNLIRIEPSQYTGQQITVGGGTVSPADLAGALILAVVIPQSWMDLLVPGAVDPTPGFLLYNTHSLPIPLEDMELNYTFSAGGPLCTGPLTYLLDTPVPCRGLTPLAQPYTGAIGTGDFVINYYGTYNSVQFDSPTLSNDLLGYTRIPRLIDAQPYLADANLAPFLYEDRRYLFYVTTKQAWVTIRQPVFGVPFGTFTSAATAFNIPPIVMRQGPIALPPGGDPVLDFTGKVSAATDPAALQTYAAAQAPNISVALHTGVGVTYQGQQLTPTGSPLAANAIRAATAVED
jgi:peptidoglycan hydrolase-like protein with peptidoglycan-binding domain